MPINSKSYYSIFLVVLFLFSTKAQLFAQDHSETENHGDIVHHRIALMIGHTHVPKAVQSTTGGSGTIIVPSWGLNYDYWFSNAWALGLHMDMEIATYIIEDNTGTALERERPIIISIVGTYKPWKGLMLGVGFGKEFEPHHDFWVYRFGVEYEIEIGHHWDIAPALVFDVKEDLYDSWTIGLGVGKRF